MHDAILERWYAALKAGDVPAFAAATTEDVVVRWNGPVGTLPWAGTWQGRPKVLTFFKRIAENLDIVSVDAVERFEHGDGALVVIEGHWRMRMTGRDIRARAANLFRFEGGRVAAYEVFPDSHAFVAALG